MLHSKSLNIAINKIKKSSISPDNTPTSVGSAHKVNKKYSPLKLMPCHR